MRAWNRFVFNRFIIYVLDARVRIAKVSGFGTRASRQKVLNHIKFNAQMLISVVQRTQVLLTEHAFHASSFFRWKVNYMISRKRNTVVQRFTSIKFIHPLVPLYCFVSANSTAHSAQLHRWNGTVGSRMIKIGLSPSHATH